jgi:hypothetical protein
MYKWSTTQTALEKRFASLKRPEWVSAMVTLIGVTPYFRWHDSGDLQSVAHLEKICEVARQTPNTRHWLPTRERNLLEKWLKANPKGFPDNLTVRWSYHWIDPKSIPKYREYGTSTVHTEGAPITGVMCSAPKQGGECGSCRACWNPRIANISYQQH